MTDSSTGFDQVLADHQHLNEALGKVRQTLASDAAGQQQVADSLEDLKQQLLEHFAHEEGERMFEKIATLDPRLSDQAMSLKEEHAKLASSLEEVIASGEQAPWNSQRQQLVSVKFSAFLGDFGEHEEGENDLLQEVYDRDVGSKD